MADSYLTSADVAYFNRVDMDITVSDVLNRAPALAAMAARRVAGNDFKYTRLTAAPSVGFRAINDGRENAKATREQVSVDLKYLDASFNVDVAAAKVDHRGVDHVMAEEAMAHLEQALFEVESQIWYGTGNDANGFAGFASQTNLNNAADAMVVNAGGTTVSTGSSVWLVRFGDADVEVLWGQDGEISISDRMMVQRAGSSAGTFWAYAHDISGWCGVKIGSTYSVARIANLTEDSGKGLTDALIAQAIAKFPAGRGPNVMVMNRRSLRQLQSSRTATTPTGAPAPFPVESHGVPIIVTDSILSTETLLA